MTSRWVNGIILKNINYGEKDRIISVLSSELGFFTAIMCGAVGSRKRFGGFLEIFSTVTAEVVPGEGLKMCKVLRANLVNPHEAIAADLKKISCASVICEATASFFKEGQGKGRAYSILEAALDTLNDCDAEVSNALMCAYLVKLLKLCGFLPQFRCTSCRASPLGEIRLAVRHGQFICGNCVRYLQGAHRAEFGKEAFGLLESLLKSRFADISKEVRGVKTAISQLIALLKLLTSDILGYEMKSFSWVEN